MSFLDNSYTGDAWSRLRDWLKAKHDLTRGLIMSGDCLPEDYRALCRQAQTLDETLNQMRLISSGQDLLEKREPSPLRNVE